MNPLWLIFCLSQLSTCREKLKIFEQGCCEVIVGLNACILALGLVDNKHVLL